METEQNKPEGISLKLMIFNIILVLFIILMFFLIYGTLNKSQERQIDNFNQAITLEAFQNLELSAKSAYVYDVSGNRVIYKKNEFVQLPLASITKLMMALIASELIGENSRVTIKKEFLEEEGDTGLLADESWRMKDLLDFSLVTSSNDGARSLASVIGAYDLKTENFDFGRKDFISKMNQRAQELGLQQTYFVNESGLDNGSISGGYGSAIDTAKLMQYILKNKPELLEATKYQSITVNSLNKEHIAKNTNIEVSSIPGLIASKTGYTDKAGGNLAVAFDLSIGRPIIVVVLGSTIDGRFEDVSKLVAASFDSISQESI
ncbi:MAG: hypothetical protein A3H52_02830 [Candidatus Zambryskibacteria bacterium RIFCSPLOWO2_02_FULL_39_26]|uniref:Peptidase S11 D-alanyl-D-alanine carboxypeptidase A N-terminal domain-containing protein n=1 Tax=Candidatus Zambryskibacteria bacterium RIFCSPLOWO2_12_FULL_39_23 TaxID=1802776 RepID=A0A1G2UR13_9BACT|nr:MAG: hypothetical protein A2W51_00890 [Candidatus Zambryskibacteria bacterium RIFCSPHIGHO2_02_39_10]OHB00115.1 MAG: hypothetical protein A3E59_00550 [Candidatus Zambryskibacteria bacterium RIFCSPHIGHO2_12_FULL_39_47]OHB10387.1 MAG: hypothetical protein A3H52_02830 [Candidatus Zambryskibacteria bacterium RIFCSPLOWO2_02_FULL_39_26]OHB11742.1 MAG: hypothetical protein A3G99_03205 [Candidatus Zambryskibacteria bacterium RIFCSPLOWO2_12_FULL_39_23]